MINKLERLHRQRSVEELANQFAEPLIVFPIGGPSRRAWRHDTRVSIEKLLAANDSAGVASLSWQELALEKQVAGNESILVRWIYSDARGDLVAHTDVRYFCGHVEDGSLKVLMIEYLSVAFPTALSAMPKSYQPTKLI